MVKVADRKKYNEPEVDKLVGKKFVHDAYRRSDEGDFESAQRDYKLALASYHQALKHLEGNPKLRDELESLESQAKNDLREAERKSHIHRQTSNYIAPFRWLVRRLRGMQVIGLFIFAFIFSDPAITAAAIGSSKASSYLGFAFFFLGIISCYLLFWQIHLVNRSKDQY